MIAFEEKIEYSGNNVFDDFLVEYSLNGLEMPEIDFVKYFLRWFDNKMFYNVETGQYHIYNGQYYKHDEKALMIKNKLSDFIDKLHIYSVQANKDNSVIYKIMKLKSETKIELYAKALQRATRLESNELNQDELLLNLENGVLDLRTFKLLKHSSKYKITQMANVRYNPKSGEVDGIAKEILLSFFLGDEEILTFIFEYFGACLSGFAGIRKFIYAYGSGKNGKSTLFNFFVEFFGSYATTTNFQAFTGTRDNTRASSDLVPLFDKRLVIANEAQTKHKLNTNLIKSITGGDNINARRNYMDDAVYKPHCKLVLFGNNQLEIDDSSDGMQNRYTQVPFLAKFNKENQKPQSEIWEILNSNKTKILNSLILAYKRLVENNGYFTEAESIKLATLDGFASANSFVRFTNEYLIEEELSTVTLKDIYDKYKKFAENEELSKSEIMKRSEVKNALKSSNFKIIYSHKRRTDILENYKLNNSDMEALL